MRLSAAEKVNIGFAVALFIVATVGIASVASINRFADISADLAASNSALTELEGAITDLTAAESAQRGFVITGDETYLIPLNASLAKALGKIDHLQGVSLTTSRHQQALAEMERLAGRRIEILNDVIRARREAGMDSARSIVAKNQGLALMESIRSIAASIQTSETQRLQNVSASADARARLAYIIIIVGSLFAFMVVLAAGMVIRRDYTERRRAEHALRESETLLSQFMENLPIGVIVIDSQWQPRFANNAAVDILGPSVLVDTGERPLPLFRVGEQRPYTQADTPLARALAGETSTIDDAEVHLQHRSVPLQVSAAPIYDASGRIAYVIAAFSDITERRRTEEALRTAKDAAEAASRTKSDFLARMSHELRTPLNSVIGFANILLKNKAGNLREQDTAYLDRILENGKHLLLLINDILDLSKIEAGKIQVEKDSVDIRQLITNIVSHFEAQPKSATVHMRTVLPAELEPVFTDAARLRQILTNLVSNAVKFTEQGTVTVTIEVAAGSRRAARIRVQDTGIGIAEDRLDAIFDAFEQAESSTSRKYGGTGLGLPISRALCELLGYKLSVRSRVGFGTEFVVDMLPGETLETHSGIANRGRVASTDRLVLIVDDESDSRVLLSHYVEEFGCRAVATHSPSNALQLARELRPDLITLDLMMPELNGWDVLAALKADPELADIPVIVVSIIAHESRGSLLGALDLIQKPVDRDKLYTVLRRNLGSPHSRVLIVEDNPDSRRLLSDMLESMVAEIRTANNGKEALAVLREFEPDLVITDLLMPVMDGMTFLEVFRGTPRFAHVPVIVVSAKDITSDERERLDRHTAAVLRKGNALESDLRRMLGSILMHDELLGTGSGRGAA
jgi:PAS domain S-box-containing protein